MPCRLTLLLAMLVSVGACTTTDREYAEVAPRVDLRAARTAYVARYQDDKRGVEKLIAQALRKRGYDASSGDDRLAPPGTDLVVTYIDQWGAGITTAHMASLAIFFDSPAGRPRLATGYSYHGGSFTRKTPEEMIDEVLANIFNKAKSQ